MVGTRKESKGKNPDLAGALYEGLIFSQQSRYQRALSISVLSLSHAQALLFSPFSLFFFHFFLFFSFIYFFFFISSFLLLSFIIMSRANRGTTKRGGRREGRGRLSTTGLVESLNHGVVQWLQGRRKPRVGCAGQNGPSSAGILSPVQHTPSVVLFFVVVRLEE